MELEVLGLVSGTIRSDLVRRVVEYGITNRNLSWLEIFLYDDQRTKRASVVVRIDWSLNAIMTIEHAGDITEDMFPKEGEVSSLMIQKIVELFNQFKNKYGLNYWFNFAWTDNGNAHDAECGITRTGPVYPAPERGLTSRSLIHERLRELGIDVSIDTEYG